MPASGTDRLGLIAARRGPAGLAGALLRRFGPGALAEQCRALIASGLFDRDYYSRKYRQEIGLKLEPVVEYLRKGGFEGRRPNPLFDSAFYLDTYADVRAEGINPLLHYILRGEREGRRPNPGFSPEAYRAAHDLPEAASPLAHHLARAFPFKRRLPWTLRSGRLRKRGPTPRYTYIPPRRPEDLEAQIAGLALRPLFSIVVPLYNTPLDLLERLVSSVAAQWYDHWELILVDDKSPRDEVRAAMGRLQDPRIRTVYLDRNQGISGATNAGIAAACGDYVVFLDHDDELTEDCLYELALCINAEDSDFIYSDEDKLTPEGVCADPFFKPDWSPDTLMSLMYTCHVSCVRRSLLDEVGGLRPDYDGSQDWDLVLRITERAKTVSHVPKVLYHWRMIPGSTAAEFDAKPEALTAAKRLRLEAMARRGSSGEIEAVEGLPAYSRVRYFVTGNPLISIVIPSKDNAPVLRTCLDSIFELTEYKAFEVVIVDNGSTQPETLSYLAGLAGRETVRVVPHAVPFNFSELCNVGAAAAQGKILLFLNDDTQVLSRDWLERMAGYAQQAHVGAVGAKLLYPKSLTVQHAGVITIPSGPSHAFAGFTRRENGYFARNLLEYNWVAVTGACLMVEREKFERVGRFDESFPIAYNDVELCYRLIEAGLFNVVCPSAELLHYESLSRGKDHQTPEKLARLVADKARLDAAHPRFSHRDPFFNPNLDQTRLDFSYLL